MSNPTRWKTACSARTQRLIVASRATGVCNLSFGKLPPPPSAARGKAVEALLDLLERASEALTSMASRTE